MRQQDGSRHTGPLPALIFSSRWLQLPLYLGLIVAQGVYVFLFLKELWHLIHEAPSLTEQTIMLIVLGLIDVVMISNLLVMVIVGGYETFVSRLNLEGHPDQPEWLSHVNASVLKVKLAMAILGISSSHLLKTFIEAGMLGGLPLCGTTAASSRCRHAPAQPSRPQPENFSMTRASSASSSSRGSMPAARSARYWPARFSTSVATASATFSDGPAATTP